MDKDYMDKIALIETTPSSTDFHKWFEFDFDRFALLCSDSSKQKILKRDVDIDIDIDSFDWVILVGSEAFKMYTKKTSITAYNGKIIDDKFLPLMNPCNDKVQTRGKETI